MWDRNEGFDTIRCLTSHRVMRLHRWSDFFLPHTVLHCGSGGCVDLTVMWCSSEEFHVLNSWEMDEMWSKSEKSSALSDPEHVCLTVDQTGRMWTHTEPGLCYKVSHCSPVGLTFGAGCWFILISTCWKTAASKAKPDDSKSLSLCRDPVSGQWCMEAHDGPPQWQTYTKTVTHTLI